MTRDMHSIANYTLAINAATKRMIGEPYTTLVAASGMPELDYRRAMFDKAFDDNLDPDQFVLNFVSLHHMIDITGLAGNSRAEAINHNLSQAALISFAHDPSDPNPDWKMGTDGSAYASFEDRSYRISVDGGAYVAFMHTGVEPLKLSELRMDEYGRIHVPTNMEFAPLAKGFDLGDAVAAVAEFEHRVNHKLEQRASMGQNITTTYAPGL